jgi:predicted RecB family nuclease
MMGVPKMLSAYDVSRAVSDPFGLWHDHHGDERLRDQEDEYGLFLQEQGMRVEKELLGKRHDCFTDLKGHDFDAAARLTADLLRNKDVVIYGGALQSESLGLRVRPDVLKIEQGRCLIEEYKLAGMPDETHRIQVLVYAYLLKKGYGIENTAMVVSRRNEEFPVPYNEQSIKEIIQASREILAREQPPYPVYNCNSDWGSLQNERAKELQDVSLAWNVGPVHARVLHQMKVHTLEELAKMKPESLRMIKGLGPTKVPQILNSAKAQVSQTVIRVGTWSIRHDPAELELFLDLEGTSELFQDDPGWNCLYLIGLIPRQGGKAQPYLSYLAKRPENEKAILVDFLAYLREHTGRYRLYHWHSYEKTQLKKACERHGLQDDCESLILPHLVDLCPAAQSAYMLPTPGWSIKVVAPYFGFEWTQDASEVDAMNSAMIWFKQAVNGGSGDGLEKVLRYNQDDCQAMIVVKDGFDALERKI